MKFRIFPKIAVRSRFQDLFRQFVPQLVLERGDFLLQLFLEILHAAGAGLPFPPL
jgi:hypothetical protein